MLKDKELTDISSLLQRSKLLRNLSESDCQDVVQSTLAILVTKYPDLPFAQSARVSFEILRRLIAEHQRKLAKSRVEDFNQDAWIALSPNDDVSSRLELQEAANALEQLKEVLSEALIEGLTPEESEIIHRRFYENQKLREIAESKGISISEAHRLVASAVLHIHGRMAQFRDLYHIAFPDEAEGT